MKDQENSMAGGDMTKREKLQDVLSHYATHTLAYIHTVRGFCDGFSKWMLTREEEVKHMADIKTRADKIDLNFSHITKSENTGKACVEFFKSKVTQMTSNTRRTKLQMELAKVLKDTLKGLKELHFFLAAVEKLAVTSLHVFKENQVVQLPIEIDRGCIQAAITASQQICPLLLEFKRDPEVFFLPKLQNIDVLEYQLGRYLETSRKFCKKFKKRAFSRGYMNLKTVIDLSVDLSEDDIQRMIKDIDQLTNIRVIPILEHLLCKFTNACILCYLHSFCTLLFVLLINVNPQLPRWMSHQRGSLCLGAPRLQPPSCLLRRPPQQSSRLGWTSKRPGPNHHRHLDQRSPGRWWSSSSGKCSLFFFLLSVLERCCLALGEESWEQLPTAPELASLGSAAAGDPDPVLLSVSSELSPRVTGDVPAQQEVSMGPGSLTKVARGPVFPVVEVITPARDLHGCSFPSARGHRLGSSAAD
ncbi:uncharacterized protein KZ484_004114 isoform 2-T2 [Pholidichthys leucotaenia]